MHQIRFPLGIRPRHRWGNLHRFLKPPRSIKGPTSKGRERSRGEGKGTERESLPEGNRKGADGREDKEKSRSGGEPPSPAPKAKSWLRH